MKYIFVAFCLLSLSASAQYRESGDTIFINDHILLPGDTVHLGLGSDPYKNFVFVTIKPSILTYSQTSNGSSVPKLESFASLKYLIYSGMQYKGKKAIRNKTGYPTFLLYGKKNPFATCAIDFPSAIAAGEVKL